MFWFLYSKVGVLGICAVHRIFSQIIRIFTKKQKQFQINKHVLKKFVKISGFVFVVNFMWWTSQTITNFIDSFIWSFDQRILAFSLEKYKDKDHKRAPVHLFWLILSKPVQSCPILSNPVQFYPILSNLVQSCLNLFNSILSCLILF